MKNYYYNKIHATPKNSQKTQTEKYKFVRVIKKMNTARYKVNEIKKPLKRVLWMQRIESKSINYDTKKT